MKKSYKQVGVSTGELNTADAKNALDNTRAIAVVNCYIGVSYRTAGLEYSTEMIQKESQWQMANIKAVNIYERNSSVAFSRP